MLLSLCLILLGASAAKGQTCTDIPGKLQQLDAGAGEVYGVTTSGSIYKWQRNVWVQVPGEMAHVSVGPAGVWATNKRSSVYKLQDNDWMSVSGLLKQIDAGGDKYLAGVNTEEVVYCLNRYDTISGSPYTHFTTIPGRLVYYSCGRLGCWGVNNASDIYFRYNVKPTACEGSQWWRVEGSLTMLEVGTDGSVFGLSPDGKVYKREGITYKKPTGTSWVNLNFLLQVKHVTYDAGALWLLSLEGDILKCEIPGTGLSDLV
ncbi:fish-egg lectin [Xenopus laevis]|uniref:Fish-egg lectin n=2 Tax=Xenopus laevis TaxID=8355 RepID=A0A8J1LFW7_XENLA|nr:fish-egg lectin [Xenopus laevis]